MKISIFILKKSSQREYIFVVLCLYRYEFLLTSRGIVIFSCFTLLVNMRNDVNMRTCSSTPVHVISTVQNNLIIAWAPRSYIILYGQIQMLYDIIVEKIFLEGTEPFQCRIPKFLKLIDITFWI